MDGIDVAVLEWDEEGRMRNPRKSHFVAYESALRRRLETVIASAGREGDVLLVQRDLTVAHAQACAGLLQREGMDHRDVTAMGFHGHTVVHRPREGITWQIGDAQLLCHLTGIDVVSDFRSRDVAAGGQGAPLLPLYHASLVEEQHTAEAGTDCYAVVNIGGVANATFISFREKDVHEVVACDTGPGNALLDDWTRRCTDGAAQFDKDGQLARSGHVATALLEEWLAHPFFGEVPPKSLDRNAFHAMALESERLRALSPADGAATLVELTVEAIVRTAEAHAPVTVAKWLVTGGGRRNSYMMDRLRERTTAAVMTVDELGWDGDMLEAEGFAFLARRVLKGQTLSLPGTTGVSQPQCGGCVTRGHV